MVQQQKYLYIYRISSFPLSLCSIIVTVIPKFTPIFSGDSINLKCSNSAAGSPVTWYFNNAVVSEQKKQTWSIAVATPENSGSYRCESDGKTTDYVPPASLSIYTGQPVMPRGDAFSLALQNEDGLDGWNCWFYEGGPVRKIVFINDPPLNEDQIFQAPTLNHSEATYWCSDKTGQRRSSPVTIRTSEKQVLLEMAPVPVMAGDSVTVRCLAWGTSQIEHVVFYKDGQMIQEGKSNVYEIHSVKDSNAGQYMCKARYTHKSTTRGPPRQETSDPQQLFVRGMYAQAVLSAANGMSCSCSVCGSNVSYHWYFKGNDDRWAVKGEGQHYDGPSAAGSYACRAVWPNKRTLLSNVHSCEFLPFLLPQLILISVTSQNVLRKGFERDFKGETRA
uniref:Ig-like domain-containing protein n=1 Tax=Myripristis murdjan TaxID=586833 RepID=A0A667ZHT2_9TELE